MSCNATDLVIQQGKTFSRVFRKETLPIVYKTISNITQSAPVSITCTLHGLPDGWPVAITSVKGMREINSKNTPPIREVDYWVANVVNQNTIEINQINSTEFKAYSGGGVLQYNTPQDYTGCIARMQIKDRLGGNVLETLTTENGKITLDNIKKTINIELSASQTAAYLWARGVYELELVYATGRVERMLYGNVLIDYEVTT